MLADSPIMVFCLLVGCAVTAAGGVGLLAISLYGFFLWIEVKKFKRRRRKRLRYRDML